MTTAHDLLWRHILREKRREAARYSEAITAARAMRAERAAPRILMCAYHPDRPSVVPSFTAPACRECEYGR